MTKKFEPPFVRDRKVIRADIEYAESILKRNPNNEKLKQTVEELTDELNNAPSSFVVDFGVFVYLFWGVLLFICILKKIEVI